jgi:hypothetical protein
MLGMKWHFLVNVIAFAVTALSSFAATAGVDPLLVVVETAPGAGVEAVEVRRIITGELGAPVMAPGDPAAPETSDLLIVAVDRAEIRMWLRGRAEGVVSRTVAAPGDRKGRLQSIGWLAGNLARDQVGAVVASAPAPIVSSVESVDAAPSSHAEAPPPAAPPVTDPPPFAENAARETAGAPGGVVSTEPSPAAAGSAWSLTLGGGPSALFQGDRDQRVWPGPGVWYLELQRRASSNRLNGLILGAALDVGPDMALAGIRGASIDFMGLAVLVGAGHHFGRILLEATGGLGVEAYQSTVSVEIQPSPESGVTPARETFSTFVLGLYLRGQVTGGLALSKSFDLLASVGGHLGTIGRQDAFFSSSLAVRFRF